MVSLAPFSVRILRRPGFDVAVVTAATAAASFPKHTHDEFVLGANLAGAERVWLDGRTFEAGPGDVTAYNPGALQAGVPLAAAGARWTFVSLYVQPAFAAEALGLPTAPWLGAPVRRHLGLAARLEALGRAVAIGGARGDSCLTGAVEEAAIGILGALARPAGIGDADPTLPARGADPALDRAAAYLLGTLAAPPTLASVAREAGLSREHLSRRFAARFGLPPMAWALQRRLARARTLLRGGVPPAEAAAALGFADQAHLTRAFRFAMGLTPGRYARP